MISPAVPVHPPEGGHGKAPTSIEAEPGRWPKASTSLGSAMWGYAQGNATIVGIVVVIIGAAAIGYVVRRLWRRGR